MVVGDRIIKSFFFFVSVIVFVWSLTGPACGIQFAEVTTQSGLDTPTACRSVAAADFDNDMDIDFYLVCRNPVANIPNRLYENSGTGNKTVDNLIVIWPSGIRQESTNIQANQIVKVVEPNTPEDAVGSRVICDDQYIPPEKYWTPERMKDAVPPSMEIEVPELGKEENIQDESDVPEDASPGFAPGNVPEPITH